MKGVHRLGGCGSVLSETILSKAIVERVIGATEGTIRRLQPKNSLGGEVKFIARLIAVGVRVGVAHDVGVSAGAAQVLKCD